MCGICGQYIFDQEEKVPETLIRNMMGAMRRRGPDHSGLYIRKNVGLGACVLKVRDPNNSRQPFYNERKTVISIFNGEIYNHRELRDDLAAKGHDIRTACDAEIIAHMYEEYGTDFISRLNGMFAVALSDIENDVFFLGRDRMGIKPLYYCLEGGRLTFASGLKAVLNEKAVSPAPDIRGIGHYFSFNYFPGIYTPIKDIKKLLPGHNLIVKNKRARIAAYWKFKYICEKKKSSQEYAEEFNAVFERVMKDQSVCDVPLGALVSGGLDSAGIQHCFNLIDPGAKTFSVGFQEKTFDEQDNLRYFSQDMQRNCYKCRLPEAMDSLMDAVAESLDMPAGEGSYVPFYYLSEFAGKYVTAAFSGEGADELFGGYEMYAADVWAGYCRIVPKRIRTGSLRLLIRALPVGYEWMNLRFSLELFLKGITEQEKIPHYFWREVFSEQEKTKLFSADVCSQALVCPEQETSYDFFEKIFEEPDPAAYLEKAMYFDTRFSLADGMLQRTDMAAMYHSLEVRVPYLDNRIVDFALRLPLSMKINSGSGKFLLRQAFKDKLPKEIISRRKHGMSAPVSKWIKGELKDFIYCRFSKRNVFWDDIIDRKYVLKTFNDHCDSRIDAGRKLWNLLMLSLWMEKAQCQTGSTPKAP